MINWFEIPVKDLKRAKSFYQELLDVEINEVDMHGTKMGFFPNKQNSVSGALVKGEGYSPSESGSLLYLNGGKDLNKYLQRVEKLGGQVLVEKTKIGDDAGFFGLFIDTESNRIAFHSIS